MFNRIVFHFIKGLIYLWSNSNPTQEPAAQDFPQAVILIIPFVMIRILLIMGLTGVEQVTLPGPSRGLVGCKFLAPDALFSPLLSRRNALLNPHFFEGVTLYVSC